MVVVETSLPTPMTGRVYVNLLEDNQQDKRKQTQMTWEVLEVPGRIEDLCAKTDPSSVRLMIPSPAVKLKRKFNPGQTKVLGDGITIGFGPGL